MVIIGDDRFFKAINETNIYQQAKDFDMSISIFESDSGRYNTLYVFFSDDDDLELLREIDEYDELEKIIYEDYSDEELEEYGYDGHWYDEVSTLRVSVEIEEQMKKDKEVRHKQIKLLDDRINKRISEWLAT